MLDVIASVGVTALPVVLAALGIYVVLRPPASRGRTRWMLAFVVCGALGVALTGLAQYRKKVVELELRSESAKLRDELAKAQPPKQAPRSLTARQQETLPNLLQLASSCELGIRHTEGDPEGEQYGEALAALIKRAGWNVRTPEPLFQDKEAPGVWVMVHREEDAPQCARVLLAALNAVGIEASGVEVSALQPGTFDLLVGRP